MARGDDDPDPDPDPTLTLTLGSAGESRQEARPGGGAATAARGSQVPGVSPLFEVQ